jgi:hypothetical protein
MAFNDRDYPESREYCHTQLRFTGEITPGRPEQEVGRPEASRVQINAAQVAQPVTEYIEAQKHEKR